MHSVPLKVSETEELVEFVNALPPPENRGLLLWPHVPVYASAGSFSSTVVFLTVVLKTNTTRQTRFTILGTLRPADRVTMSSDTYPGAPMSVVNLIQSRSIDALPLVILISCTGPAVRPLCWNKTHDTQPFDGAYAEYEVVSPSNVTS